MNITWLDRLSRYGLSKNIVATLFLLSLFSTVTQMVGIGVFIPVFEYIFNGDKFLNDSSNNNGAVFYFVSFIEYLGIEASLESLLTTTFTFYLISQVFSFVISYVNIYYSGKMVRNMRKDFLSYYLSADSEYYDSVKISDVVNITFTELGTAVSGVLTPIKLMVAIVSFVGSIILLFILSYELTIYSILLSMLALGYPAFLISKTTKAGRENSEHNKLLTSFLVDRLRSPRLVRLCGTKDAEISEYEQITEKQRKLTLYIQLLKEKIGLSFEPTVILSTLIMLYISIKFLKIEASTVFVFMIILVRLVPITRVILNMKQAINRTKGPIELVDGILDDMDQKSTSSNLSSTKLEGDKNSTNIDSIELVNVFYKYTHSENFALNNISVYFNNSTVNAIVGPSGGGKSTLIDIISGYRSPTMGNVLINGETLNSGHYNISNFLAYVPQQPQIFDGSIMNHIRYGSLNKTDEMVLEASKLSGAHSFIIDFADGYETVLNGNGSNLSGGQRFRLDFARALLSDSSLLILDEPMSALDYLSKNMFIKSIKKIKNDTNKIIIIITHDLSIYPLFDAILVIENGVVSTDKIHKDLVKNNTWYCNGISNTI